jgi:signal transduction histidine kinase
MTLLDHYLASLILTTVVTTALGLWIFIQKRDSKVAQVYCLYSLAVGFWSWCQAMAGFSSEPTMSLAWARAMFYVVITLPVLLTHFFSTFLKVDQRRTCLIGWLLVIGFLPFLSSESFLQAGGPLGFLPAFPQAGRLFLPFNLVWLGWILYSLSLLARGPTAGEHPTKRQVNFLLKVFSFGYASGSVNYLYLYGMCFPPLQPFATYGVPIGFLAVATGVFAYGLFDIHVVIRRSLVYSLLVTALTVGYFGFVYGVEWLFRRAFGYHSVWLSLSAFALMALGFQPLKFGIQRVVDWLFFRAPHEEVVRRMERLEQEVRQAEKLKAVSTLAAGLAHEIKNPLTSLKTFTAYLSEKRNDPAFQERFCRIVTQEVDKIDCIVRRLLDFAKPALPRLQPVQVSKLLDETLDFLNSEALKRRVEIKRSYEPEDTIQADPQQLRQVFLNLFLNSFEAMNGSGGMLSVSTTRQGERMAVTIQDTGCGIPKERLSHVFEPFFTTKHNGTGLGLSVVQGIIQEHRGTVRFASEPGQGTTVTLSLPLG